MLLPADPDADTVDYVAARPRTAEREINRRRLGK
jgi:hypothetical protein